MLFMLIPALFVTVGPCAVVLAPLPGLFTLIFSEAQSS